MAADDLVHPVRARDLVLVHEIVPSPGKWRFGDEADVRDEHISKYAFFFFMIAGPVAVGAYREADQSH